MIVQATDPNKKDHSGTVANDDIHINGVAPTLSTVTLTPDAVVADGKTVKTVQATATSTSKKDITTLVDWSIAPADKDVTINAKTGEITVPAKANEQDYTVTATPRKDASLGTAQIATLKVTREAAVPTTITLTPAKAEMIIPVEGAENDTNVITATVKDQYGTVIKDPEVAWSMEETVVGVDVHTDGVLYVESKAKDLIAESDTVTVQAICNGHTATANVTVKRAASVQTTLTITGEKTLAVPTAAEGIKEARYKVIGCDQYGAEMSTVQYSWHFVDPGDTGVEFNGVDRELIVKPDDNAGTVTLVAKSGNVVSDPFAVTITKAKPVATTVELYKGEAKLGANDTVIVPAEGQNEYTYTAKVYDQFGAEMPAETVTWSAADTDENMSVTGSKLTVKAGTTLDKKITLTATTKNEKTKSVEITAKNIEITAPTVTVAEKPVYGDKWSKIVTYKDGSAALNGKTVEGSFYLKNADTVPNAGEQTYEIYFKSKDQKYDVLAATDTVKIDKKPLTITAMDQTITYGEDAPITGDATFDGKVEGDTFTVTYKYGYDKSNDESNNAGTYSICPDTNNDNYSITLVNGTLTVEPKALTLAPGTMEVTKTYDGTTKAGTASGELGLTGLVNKDEITVTGTVGAYADANVNAVGKKINVTFTGLTLAGKKAKNYTIKASGSAAVGVITKAEPTADLLHLVDAQAVYTGKDIVPEAAVNAGVKGLEIVTQNTTGFKTVGKHDVTVKVGGSNYEEKTLTLKNAFEIVKSKSELTGLKVTNGTEETRSFTYGDTITITVKPAVALAAADPAAEKAALYYGTEKLTDDVAKNTEGAYVLTYKTTDKKVPTGTKTLTVKYGGDANLNASQLNVEVTIAKKSLPLTWDETTTFNYDGKAHEVKATFKAADLEVADEVTLKLTDNKQTNVGKYTAKAALDGKGKDFYALTPATCAFEIKSVIASVTVKPDTVKATVTDPVIKLEGTIKDGEKIELTIKTAGGKTVTVADAKDGDKVTIDGMSYTIDAKGVKTESEESADNTVIILPTKHGDVIASNYKAKTGDTVILEVRPDFGYKLDNLVVKDYFNNKLTLKQLGTNKYYFVMPATKAYVYASFAPNAGEPFVDVNPTDWFYDEVVYNYINGLMNGVDATHFNPNGTLTRGMVVTMLYRLEGSPAAYGKLPFADVKDDTWYSDAILWAANKGIVNGYSSTSFGPNDAVTREQLAKMLYGYVQYNGGGFKGMWSFRLDYPDASSVSDWAYEAMCWCTMNKIINGSDNGMLMPQGLATRAQAAAMFMRLIEMDK